MRLKRIVFLLLLAAFVATACGKKAPPKPPAEGDYEKQRSERALGGRPG